MVARGFGEIPIESPFAVTVPGAVDAWCRLHVDYGRLPFKGLLEPAIRAAENGFMVMAVWRATGRNWPGGSRPMKCRVTRRRSTVPRRTRERHKAPELGARCARSHPAEGPDSTKAGSRRILSIVSTNWARCERLHGDTDPAFRMLLQNRGSSFGSSECAHAGKRLMHTIISGMLIGNIIDQGMNLQDGRRCAGRLHADGRRKDGNAIAL